MEANNCMVSCDSVKDKVVEFQDNRQQVCRIYCNIHFLILSHFRVPNLKHCRVPIMDNFLQLSSLIA